MKSASRPLLTSRMQGFGTSVFAEYTRLASEHRAVNLGMPALPPSPAAKALR